MEGFSNEVSIPADEVSLKGDLFVPANAGAIIVFSHGSGSSRFSRRNRSVAEYLHQRNFGTLLFDLLTVDEDANYYNRFDIHLLTKRLIDVTAWLINQPEAKNCRIGYFGASTGAASALQAAAYYPVVDAVVSRGGRPDLADIDALQQVQAPTLLIVGSLDVKVLELNKEAFLQLNCEKQLQIVEGADHLFEEYGKLEEVSRLAAAWFEKHLVMKLAQH